MDGCSQANESSEAGMCEKSHTQLIDRNKDRSGSSDTELGVGCRMLEGPELVCVSVWLSLEGSLLHEAWLVPAPSMPTVTVRPLWLVRRLCWQHCPELTSP